MYIRNAKQQGSEYTKYASMQDSQVASMQDSQVCKVYRITNVPWLKPVVWAISQQDVSNYSCKLPISKWSSRIIIKVIFKVICKIISQVISNYLFSKLTKLSVLKLFGLVKVQSIASYRWTIKLCELSGRRRCVKWMPSRAMPLARLAGRF